MAGGLDDLREKLGAAARWGEKGASAVGDQGLYSAGNFLLNLALARWLVPAEYGAFAVAFTVFLLVGTVHTGFLTDPVLVFGASRYADRFRTYLGEIVLLHVLFSIGVLLLLLAAAGAVEVAGQTGLTPALGAFALVAPVLLLLWLLRRACYVVGRPRTAAVASGAYLALLVAGLAAVRAADAVSPLAGAALMGLASLLPAAWLVWRLEPELPAEGAATGFRREVWRRHWSYGRWAAGVGLVGWIPLNAYYVLLPLWGGMAAAGALRALMNLVTPLLQGLVALGTLVQTMLARHRDSAAFGTILRRALLFLGAGALGYWGLVGSLQEPILELLYAGKYVEHAAAVWILGGLCAAKAGSDVMEAALRALERPDLVFRAYLAGAGVALTLGVGLVALTGLTGAAWGILLSSATAAAVLFHVLRRERESAVTWRAVGAEAP